ncbi:hypothetical protein EV363DRAFT_1095923, partial [Boletus edulis]
SSTPKCRKLKNGTSISSWQKDRAGEADPNQGVCLITNRPTPVDTCHLVQAIDDDTAGICVYKQFNIDTRRNLLYLQANWHRFFDLHSEWMLVPETEIVQELTSI